MSTTRSLTQHVHEWFDQVWNQRDESAIDRMLHPKASIDGIGTQDATSLRGPEEFKQFYHAMLSGIPDIKVTITKVIEQGDWAAVRFVCEGTHTGAGLGVPPTNKKVTFSALGLGRVENGQWAEGWNIVDFVTLNQQIGGVMRLG